MKRSRLLRTSPLRRRKATRRKGMRDYAGFRAECLRIWETEEHACKDCGAWIPDPPTVSNFHHEVFRSQGGGHVGNVRLVCDTCHDAYHGRKRAT